MSDETIDEPPPLPPGPVIPPSDPWTGERGRSDGSQLRRTAKWVLGGLLAVDVALLLLIMSLTNVTASGPGTRTLEHSFAILIEIDTYLDDHYETLRLEAFEAQGSETVELPDLPFGLSFMRDEITTTDRETFRAMVLAQGAERLYEDGVDVLQENRSSEINFFSPQGALDSGMDFLPSAHSGLKKTLIALASAAAVLALGLALSSRGYGRVLAVGLSVFLAAAPFVFVAVAARFTFRVAADGVDDYMAEEYLQLAQELTWAPIRNGIIFATGSGIVLAVGFALAQWSDRRTQA